MGGSQLLADDAWERTAPVVALALDTASTACGGRTSGPCGQAVTQQHNHCTEGLCKTSALPTRHVQNRRSHSGQHTSQCVHRQATTVLQQAYITITMLLEHHHGQDTPNIAQSAFSRASRCDVQSCALPPRGHYSTAGTHTYNTLHAMARVRAAALPPMPIRSCAVNRLVSPAHIEHVYTDQAVAHKAAPAQHTAGATSVGGLSSP